VNNIPVRIVVFTASEGRRRRPIIAVSLLDLRAYFLETLALIHHLHHVTRDADADRSAETHAIEYRFIGCRIVMKVTRRVARVPLLAAAAERLSIT